MNKPLEIETEAQIKRYSAFLESDPTNASLLVSLGDLHHQAGHFSRAAGYFEDVLARDPGHAIARGRLANVYISEHKFEQAEAALRELGEEALAVPALQHNLGLSLYYQEKWDEALDLFLRAANGGIYTAENLACRAHCLHRKGEIEAALEAAAESRNLAPGERIEGYLAILHMDNGDFEAASEVARQVLAHNPNNADANIVVGTYALEKQEIELALGHLQISLDQDPENSRGWLGLGLVQMYEQNFDAAIESFQRSLRYNPRNSGTTVTLGWAYIAQSNLEQAEATFRHAIELDRSFAEAHGGLASVLAMAQRSEEAREEIRRARGLDKGSFGAVFALSILLDADGKHETAARLLGESFKRKPSPGSMSLIEAIELFARRQSAGHGPPRLLDRD